MDKLQILNRALIETGNNRINALNDGSDEWQVADSAFDRGLDDLITRRKWNFAIATTDLVAATINPSEIYDHAYTLPLTCLHLKAVFVGGVLKQVNYEIIGRALCLDETDIAISFVAEPPDASWHPQAAEILTQRVEIGCLRGLNEDFDEAYRREVRLESRLIEAATTVDQQNPARNAFKSAIAESRRTRRGSWRG